jgi:hypothetical protein
MPGGSFTRPLSGAGTWILKIWPGTRWSLVELGVRFPQPPPKGGSANIMNITWNLLQLFEMGGASYHWSLDRTHILLNIKYVSPIHFSLLDLKPFLQHSVLLNYSSLFLPCLLNCHWKVSLRIEYFSQLRKIKRSIYCVLLHQEMILSMHHKLSCSVMCYTNRTSTI